MYHPKNITEMGHGKGQAEGCKSRALEVKVPWIRQTGQSSPDVDKGSGNYCRRTTSKLKG